MKFDQLKGKITCENCNNKQFQKPTKIITTNERIGKNKLQRMMHFPKIEKENEATRKTCKSIIDVIQNKYVVTKMNKGVKTPHSMVLTRNGTSSFKFCIGQKWMQLSLSLPTSGK